MFFLFVFISIIVSISSIIAAYNYFSDPVLRDCGEPLEKLPLVSILIPARNEEGTIANCLNLTLKQTYPNIEIIVLDDNSEDGTAAMARSIADSDQRVRLLSGEPLPENWLGKNWACNQLAQAAGGDLLLFIDADVQITAAAVRAAVSYLHSYDIAMLSLFPTQKIASLGAWLIVPLMNWLLLSFLPLRTVFTSRRHSFIAANGQFLLIRKKAYEDLGGHETVKDKVVEDMEIARWLKTNGYKIMTLLGGKLVFCRMYSDIQQSIAGFTKNFYPGFNTSPLFFLSMIISFFTAFTTPFFFISTNRYFFFTIALIIISRIFISLASCQNFLLNIILHPIQMLFMLVIGIRSVHASCKGSVTWKGRHL